LESYLIEISAIIFAKKDDVKGDDSYVVDKILDKTGMKVTAALRRTTCDLVA